MFLWHQQKKWKYLWNRNRMEYVILNPIYWKQWVSCEKDNLEMFGNARTAIYF